MLCKTSGALNRKEVICWSKVGQIQNRKNELPRTKNKKKHRILRFYSQITVFY